MKTTSTRWLLFLLAVVIGGGGLLGCDEEVGWEHPNRERHAAPPPERTASKSLEELQREWRREDRMQSSPQHSKEAQAATSNTLQQATQYLQQALEAALSLINPSQFEEGQRAIGGGPLPQPDESDPDEAGEM